MDPDFEDLIEKAFLEGQISGEAMELAYHRTENSPQTKFTPLRPQNVTVLAGYLSQ